MPRSVLGLDIGGANLKAAHVDGTVRFQPFALWRNPDGLSDALRGVVESVPPFELLAITMTGELCDCFESKRQGVSAILDAVQAIAADIPVRIWQNDGRLVDIPTARMHPLSIAAANWLALATFAGRFAADGTGLLVDIGSTTTDIVPLSAGKPVPQGRTDPKRLRSHELVYTGVRRTPVCAVVGGSAAELFATTLDVYLVLGSVPENAAALDTADGRPATRAAAHARLARMLCADLETCTEEERCSLARRAALRQAYLIDFALEHVARRLSEPPRTVVLAGSGEFLARAGLNLQTAFPVPCVISLAEMLGSELSQTACAYALAVLATEQDHGAA